MAARFMYATIGWASYLNSLVTMYCACYNLFRMSCLATQSCEIHLSLVLIVWLIREFYCEISAILDVLAHDIERAHIRYVPFG